VAEKKQVSLLRSENPFYYESLPLFRCNRLYVGLKLDNQLKTRDHRREIMDDNVLRRGAWWLNLKGD
jgi:hypothetical protein